MSEHQCLHQNEYWHRRSGRRSGNRHRLIAMTAGVVESEVDPVRSVATNDIR
jgi:hypothetical protein